MTAAGPPWTGHPATHESAVAGAPPEIFQAEIVKKFHEMVTELSITERGVLGVHRVIRALDSKNLPAEKDQVRWFLQGTPQYRVYPLEGEDMEVVSQPSLFCGSCRF